MSDKKLHVGNYVKVIGNAKGTVWESGVIADIDEDGALIKYGVRDEYDLKSRDDCCFPVTDEEYEGLRTKGYLPIV